MFRIVCWHSHNRIDMALTVTVTPGLIAVDGETPINAATLNALSNPTVQVSGTIGGSTSVSVDNLTINQSGAGSSLQVMNAGITPTKLSAEARFDVNQYASASISGAADAEIYTLTLSPAPASYSDGMTVKFRAATAISGAIDININSLGARSILTNVSEELKSGDILANQIVEIVYYNGSFQLVGRPVQIAAKQTTQAVQGDVHQYGDGVYDTGVYDITLTPARSGAYVAGEVVRFKADTVNAGAADININGRGDANLFKNVTTELAAGDIPDNSVVTAVYDGTNFQMLAVAGVTNDRYVSADTALAKGSQVINAAHGLGAAPRNIWADLICITTFAGYAVGDQLPAHTVTADSGRPAFQFGKSATNVFVVQMDTSPLQILHKTTGVPTSLVEGNFAYFTIRLYAEL